MKANWFLALLVLGAVSCSGRPSKQMSSATSRMRATSADVTSAAQVVAGPSTTPPLRLSNHGAGKFFLTERAGETEVSMEELARAQELTFLSISGLGTWLRAFAELPRVHRLILAKTNGTDSGIKSLAGTSVTELHLAETDVTDAGLALLADLPNLKSLLICGGHVTDAGIASLARVSTLESLDVCKNEKLTGHGFEKLMNVRELQIRTGLAPEAFRLIAKMEGLKTLRVDDPAFGAEHMKALDGSLITKLWIREAKLGDAAIAAMPAMPQLTSLVIESDLVDLPIGDAGLRHLAERINLEELDIKHAADVTDSGVAAIARMPNLHKVGLSFSSIGDAGAQALAELPLTKLDLWHTQIGDPGLAFLEKLRNLDELSIGFTRVTNAGAPSIAKLTKLTRLTASHSLTDRGLAQLGALHDLRQIELIDSNIEAPGFAALATHDKLEYLHIGCGSVTAAALAPLAGLKKLSDLYLDCSSIDDSAVPFLASMTALEELNVVPTAITSAGRAKLAAALPNASLN